MSIQLYPGIAFSPQAALADNIGAADTIIKVTDVSAFPDAPNLATIGTDEEGETVLYAAKTADALSGCVRGVEGTAKGWSAGELIGRNFTAKDHADLISAVQNALGVAGAAQAAAATAQSAAQAAQGAADTASQNLAAHNEDPDAHEDIREELDNKQPILTGQPGQVVGFNSDGAAQAVRGWSNPNLLDNWYFVDPINQKGQTEYTGTGYAIDRWATVGLTATLEAGWIKLHNQNVDAYGYFLQKGGIDEYKSLVGLPSTISLLYRCSSPGCGIHTGRTSLDQSEFFIVHPQAILEADGQPHVTSSTISAIGAIQDEDIGQWQHMIVSVAPGATVYLNAAKLEPGPIQTLAHQDADGNWVLNDPPPDKALELAKCQRHMVVYRSAEVSNASVFFGVGVLDSGTAGQGFIILPCSMRSKPTITGGSVSIYNFTVNTAITISDILGASGNVLRVNFTISKSVSTTQRFCMLYGSGDVCIDANL